MQHLVNQEEQHQIEEAIKAFEKRSSAEIVTLIAKRSDSYVFVTTLWATLLAFIVPWSLYFTFGFSELEKLFLYQLLSFIFLSFLAQIGSLRALIVPSFIQKKRCKDAAREHFMQWSLHATNNRAALMLFVSEEEKYVEIITDIAIAKKIDDSLWQEIIQNFILRVKEAKIAQGYLESIQSAGILLEAHFPYDKTQEDELPNHLILVEE